MTETTIYCPDMECCSCSRRIEKVLGKSNGIEGFEIKKDSIEVRFNPEIVKPEGIAEEIRKLGFRADFVPFSGKTFAERFRDFTQNRKKYEVEYAAIRNSIAAFALLIAVEAIVWLVFFRQAGLAGKYFPWIIYLNIAVVSIGAAIWHLKSYRAEVTNMLGMMIGMTFGMQSGFMIGTIIGATNGMLVGTMTGMIFAVILGYYTGKCCGIMGVLQGMMAGMMGGIMGAMTGVMLSVDNIFLFMPVFMAINLLIMWGLSYMLYEEMVEENPKTTKRNLNFWLLFAFCIIAVAIFALIMFYGPKSGFARVV